MRPLNLLDFVEGFPALFDSLLSSLRDSIFAASSILPRRTEAVSPSEYLEQHLRQAA